MGFIYKIINTINNKVYIGQTRQTLKERFRKHKQVVNYESSQTALKRAFVKYGVKNFNIECIEECDNDLLNEKEKFYIEEYKSKVPNGYNMREGGEIDYTPSPKTTSKPVYQYTKEGIFINEYTSCDQAAKELNIDTSSLSKACRAILRSLSGFIFKYTKEENVSIRSRKTYKRNHRMWHAKYVYQYTKEGELVKEYSSCEEAAKEIGSDRSSVSKACRGIYKTHRNFVWSFDKK